VQKSGLTSTITFLFLSISAYFSFLLRSASSLVSTYCRFATSERISRERKTCRSLIAASGDGFYEEWGVSGLQGEETRKRRGETARKGGSEEGMQVSEFNRRAGTSGYVSRRLDAMTWE
jgi:hypothetical protein